MPDLLTAFDWSQFRWRNPWPQASTYEIRAVSFRPGHQRLTGRRDGQILEAIQQWHRCACASLLSHPQHRPSHENALAWELRALRDPSPSLCPGWIFSIPVRSIGRASGATHGLTSGASCHIESCQAGRLREYIRPFRKEVFQASAASACLRIESAALTWAEAPGNPSASMTYRDSSFPPKSPPQRKCKTCQAKGIGVLHVVRAYLRMRRRCRRYACC